MRFLPAALLFAFALTGCGPGQMSAHNPSLAGSTGYFGKDRVDYVHNGDAYVVKRQRELEANPATGKKAEKAAQKAAALNERIKEFMLTRFNSDQPTVPVLFGASRFRVTVFFNDAAPAVFEGAFDAKLHLSAQSGNFRLDGDFRDFRSVGVKDVFPFDRSSAVLHLSQLDTKAVVEISYRALKKKHTVYRARDQKLSDALATRIAQIEKTSLWENNWTVIGGKSFFSNDFIVPDGRATTSDLIAFQGESKRTSTEDEAFTYAAESLTKTTAPEVTLVGNAESSGKRAYQVSVADPSGKDHSEILVYTEPENPDPSDVTEPGGEIAAAPAVGAPEDLTVRAGAPLSEPDAPEVEPTASAAVPLPPVRPGDVRPTFKPSVYPDNGAYLPIHRELKWTALMDADLQLNRDVPGVRERIVAFQSMRGAKPGSERLRLQNFFDYAYPFRALMSAISRSFDSHPIAFYLTADESAYFTGGQYQIQHGDNGQALGPGQLHLGAAHEGKLVTNGSIDERRYFATSACGISRYLSQITRDFAGTGMDTTLALMGYNQGATGARTLAGRFGVRWKVLEGTRAGIPAAVRKYVNSKLAIYFIANNRAYYTFPDVSGHEQRDYPRNGTVVPESGIHDPICRQIVQSVIH